MIFALAPMAGISHRALRQMIMQFGGCDLYYSEMISAKGFLNGSRLRDAYTDAQPNPEQVVYQLMGSDSESMSKAASILDGRICSGIDINMGCPAPHIVKQGAGISWMYKPDSAFELVKIVRDKVKNHALSVKIRTGPENDYQYLRDFCFGLVDAGVDRITVHPRTAKQKLKRKADWSYITRLVNDIPIPVWGNGDISSVDNLKKRAQGKYDGLVIGRAAVQQPWIFAAAKGLVTGPINRQSVILQYLEYLQKFLPAELHRSRIALFFEIFLTQFVWGHRLNTLVARQKEIDQIVSVINQYFERYPDEKIIQL